LDSLIVVAEVGVNRPQKTNRENVRFEFFTAVTMKNAVF
jgi:hypothetical protein